MLTACASHRPKTNSSCCLTDLHHLPADTGEWTRDYGFDRWMYLGSNRTAHYFNYVSHNGNTLTVTKVFAKRGECRLAGVKETAPGASNPRAVTPIKQEGQITEFRQAKHQHTVYAEPNSRYQRDPVSISAIDNLIDQQGASR
jgi:hypothetical protein